MRTKLSCVYYTYFESKEKLCSEFSSDRHGIYVIFFLSRDGMIINSDLNESVNIGRKAFPELFTSGCVNFNNVEVIKHPET